MCEGGGGEGGGLLSKLLSWHFVLFRRDGECNIDGNHNRAFVSFLAGCIVHLKTLIVFHSLSLSRSLSLSLSLSLSIDLSIYICMHAYIHTHARAGVVAPIGSSAVNVLRSRLSHVFENPLLSLVSHTCRIFQ